MADSRPPSKGGREASPLWSNVGVSGFNSGQIPLLVPFNTAPASTLLQPDADQVDHFIGQHSPPNTTPVSRSDSSVALFAGEAVDDSFIVGYGSASSSAPENGVDKSVASPLHQEPYQETPSTDSVHPTLPPISEALAPSQQHYDQQPLGPSSDSQNLSGESKFMTAAVTTTPYSPVVHHWYYCKNVAGQPTWISFSHLDSMTLEESFLDGESDVVQTDGGRYDVSLSQREKKAVYWGEESCEVRRCSWFYRDDSSMTYIPYSEEVSDELEDVYMRTTEQNSWHKRNELESTKDLFVFHSPTVFVQFKRSSFPDDFGTPFSETARPKVVKRGTDGLDPITNGEAQQIDELVFVVHGIGPICDLKFRNIIECVDGMRSSGMSILSSHFQTAKSCNKVGRVEFLPIYWYDALRNDAIGVDKKLSNITLPSIAKIRELTNEILVDILFYNSPVYSQSILDKVGGELNRLYSLFRERNPGWTGKVSVAGHSLGSLILFDLLSMQGVSQPVHQPSAAPPTAAPPAARVATSTPSSEVASERSAAATPVDGRLETIETLESVLEHLSLTNLTSKFHDEQIDLESLIMCSEEDLKSIGLPLGPRKKILKFVAEREKQAEVKVERPEPVLNVPPARAEQTAGVEAALSQHSWLMETASNTQVGYVSGLQGVGFPLVQYPQLDFPVSKFFALGSPIALFLTIRGLDHLSRDFQLPTCPALFNIFHPFDPVAYRLEPLINPYIKHRPVLMPHHKGRKRLHLELKENIVKVGADIKDRVMRSIKSTWTTINDFARAHTSGGTDNQPSTEEQTSQEFDKAIESVVEDKLDTQSELESVSSLAESEVEVGVLNQGRRIDYVLQEAPFESFNDYLFALSSHLVYWESEDVSLMIMKEVYAPLGVFPDVKDKKSMSRNNSAVAPDFSSALPPVGSSNYPSQPSLAGVSYPSEPRLAGVSFPGIDFSGYQFMSRGSYPFHTATPNVSYSSQTPVADVNHQTHSTKASDFSNQSSSVRSTNTSGAPVLSSHHFQPLPSDSSHAEQPVGPPPLSGFVPTGPPPKSGFLPRQ
ncbi:phospholipase DDHD2-like [Watersipora subatra]|uniref:phospholipase DDHD2-like n=1 Tax=Watersipora subatra TaxID=2589382 RepID=UPI00355B6F43